jgi:hypothetical protein
MVHYDACRLILSIIPVIALTFSLSGPLKAQPQLTPEQKAIYDAGYQKGQEAGRRSCIGSLGTPSSTTGVPVFAAPHSPGSTTHMSPQYFLVQQSEGLGAFEFQKDANNGAVTVRPITPTALSKLFTEGKLAPVTEADQTKAVKNYYGLYQQQLKSMGSAQVPAVGLGSKP